MTMNDQEPSSTIKRQRPMPVEIVDAAEDAVAESMLDKLPPEMLMKILSNLNTKDLFLSRLISRHLNDVALAALQTRRLPFTKFTFSPGIENRKAVMKWAGGEKTLHDFISCFFASQNLSSFPFTRFRFDGVGAATFRKLEWTRFTFFPALGNTVKSLILGISHIQNDDEMTQLAKTLSRLLLKQLPNVEEFGLSLNSFGSVTSVSASLALFQACDVDAAVDLEQVQLPRLKTVHLDEASFSKYGRVVTDLLLAASNLKTVVYNNGQSVCRYAMLEHFLLLQSLGKLDCVTDLTIQPTLELLAKISVHPNPANIIPAFKLKTLELSLHQIYAITILSSVDSDQVWSNTARFVSTVLKSSKDSLLKLSTKALGFLKELELPTFSKLEELLIHEELDPNDDPTFFQEAAFPPGIKMAETFPALKFFELGIHWSGTAFPAEDNGNSISIPMPNLSRLHILGVDVKEETIVQISRFCPNLKTFVIFNGLKRSIEDFPQVGCAIWTHMKQLQSLKLSLDEESEANIFPAIDSTITGFSKEDSETFYDLRKADKLLKRRGSVAQIPQSELEVERKNPSILNLKDLKYLEICFCGWDRREGGGDGERLPPVRKKAISYLSEEYALKLMDKLVYDIDSRNARPTF